MRLFFLNPFYMFASVFLFGIILFQLNLSELYVNVDGAAIQSTVLLIIFFSFVAGWIYKLKFKKYIIDSTPNDSTKFNVIAVCTFIIMGIALEIYAAGLVPIMMVLQGSSYYYRDFGIASFHVFFLSYISASAIVGFERYLLFGTKKNLLITFLGVFFSVLIVNRAAMLMILVPCFYLYLSHNKQKKALAYILLLFLGVIIAFGYSGDKRMRSSGYTDERPIFNVAKIDSTVLDVLPSGFTWFYIYISSPYANLLNQERNPKYGRGAIDDFINVAILPDFISKRIDSTVRVRYPVVLIQPQLTVTTGFGWAVSTFGILGILLTYIYVCFLIVMFTFMNRKQHVRSILAILATTASLMVFDNMFVFAACVTQLMLITLFSSRKLTLFGKQVNLL